MKKLTNSFLRKISFFILFFILLNSSVFTSTSYLRNENKITVSYPAVNADFSDLPLSDNPGQPALPSTALSLLLPSDADLDTVTISIEGLNEEILSGPYEISPCGPFFTEKESFYPEELNIVDGKDIGVYGKNSYFPGTYAQIISVGKMRDYNIIQLTAFPYQYNPVTKQLKKLTAGEISVSYDKLSPSRITRGTSVPASINNSIKELALNYDDLKDDYSFLSQTRASTYVIIITSSLQSSLSSLPSFIESKTRRGLSVRVITESDWGGGSGLYASQNIRVWLQNNMNSLNIEYVLFIGSASTGSSVPMLRTNPDSDYQPLTDFYYADLSGNWDLNGNGIYGQFNGDFASGGADKYAEIHVSRLPYYGSTSEMNMLLDRINAYENASPADIGWRENCYLPLDPFDGYQNGIVFGEASKNNILIPANWDYYRVYYDHAGLSPELYPNNYANTVKGWHAEPHGVAIWQAHGLADLAQNIMNTAYTSNLNSNYPSHTFQISCHNGKPDASNNLAYAVLKNQSVSVIGSAVEIIYSTSINFGSGGNGNDFAYIYLKKLVEDGSEAQVAFNNTRAQLPINWGSNWLNCIELNLYGCPAVGPQTANNGPVPTPTPTVTPTPTLSPTPTATLTPTPTIVVTPTPVLVNIACGQNKGVSASFSAEYNQENLNDCNMNTAWGSSTVKPSWCYIDLGTVQEINGAGIFWYDKYFAKKYDVYISNDNIIYNKVITLTKNIAGDDVFDKDISITCRYLALLFTDYNNIAIGIKELEIYQWQNVQLPTPTATPTITPTPTGTVTPTPGCDPWEIGISYNTNDQVFYDGTCWEALQGHTSNVAWDPVSTDGVLWRRI